MSAGRTWKAVLLATAPEILLGILVLCACPRLSRTSVGAITSEDEAEYLLLAHSLHDGEGYVSSWLPGSPPHGLYPPGFPLVIDGAWHAFGATVQAAQHATIFLSIASLALAYALLRRLVGRGGALAGVAVLACSPLFWRFSGPVLSEPLATLLVLATLCAGESWREQGGATKWLALSLACAAAALSVRMACLTLFFALPIAAAWPGSSVPRLRRVVLGVTTLLAAGVLLFAWSAWGRGSAVEERGGYARALLARDLRDLDQPRASVGDLARRVRDSALTYAAECTDDVFHHFGKLGPIDWPARGVALVVMGLGAWRLLRRRRVLTVVWAAGYTTLILIHPAFEGGRLVYPVLPLLLGFTWEGIHMLGGARRGGALAAGAAAILCASSLRVTISIQPCVPRPDKAMERYLDVARTVRRVSPAGAVVICRKPCVLSLETGLRASCYPFTRQLDAQEERIRSTGATWILVDELAPETPRFLIPILDRLPWRLRLEFREGETRAYRVEGR